MSVVDLIMFLDVCQIYLQSRRKSRSLCTLWAIVTFVRTEDPSEFIRWCHAYTVPHLRYREDTVATEDKKKLRVDKMILQRPQELFNYGCLPPCDIDL